MPSTAAEPCLIEGLAHPTSRSDSGAGREARQYVDHLTLGLLPFADQSTDLASRRRSGATSAGEWDGDGPDGPGRPGLPTY
jgi:hypothetical protein